MRDLRSRHERQCFQLAVLGQFKRGKSTLLNAMLDEDLLPTSVIPVTALPTFLQFSPRRSIRITYRGDRPPAEITEEASVDLAQRLFEVVAEEANPNNTLGVARVDIGHPADLLSRGVALIDTPGIGSTHAHNTQTTLDFLPQCDAALFVVSSDPPLTQVEVDFLARVRQSVPTVFFVLNKTDHLRPDERDTAQRFLTAALRDHAGIDGARIFCVSARDALDAKRHGDGAALERSGLPALEAYILDFLTHGKKRALRVALSGKAIAGLEEVLSGIDFERRSLELPLDDLQDRLARFQAALGTIERQRRAAADLLAGERKRALEELETQAERLRREASRRLGDAVDQAIAATDDEAVWVERAEAILADLAPTYFEREFAATSSRLAEDLAQALLPHQQQADELIGSVRQAAAELFDIPFRAPDSGDAFEPHRRPYWVTSGRTETLMPLQPGMVDRLLPPVWRRRRLRGRLREQVDVLVRRNVENLRWASRQNVDDSFRHFGAQLDQRLAETVAATQGAIVAALERRRTHAETVAEALAALRTAAGDIADLIAGLRDVRAL